jgi:hypothetical protein
MMNTMLNIFRLLASSGTYPKFAEKDVWHFLAYHTSVVEFNVDARTGQLAKADQREKREKLYLMLYNTVEITLIFSILTAYSFYPFPRREIRTVLDLFYWGNLCNNYILACKCIRFVHSQLVMKQRES